MKVAIEENELELQRVSSPLTPEATAADPNLTDPQYVEQRTRQLREDLAVMYQHRGLILEKRGQQAEADADFVKAKEFGYSPENGVW